MSLDQSDPLDPEIAALLRRAEPYPAAPRDVQSRVRLALLARVAGGLAAHDLAPKRLAASGLAAKPVWLVVGALAVGGLVGAGIEAKLQPVRERIVYVDRSPLATQKASEASHPAPRSDSAPAAVSAAARPAVPEPSRSLSVSDLAAEQALLDVARAALAQGRTGDALAPLEHHAAKFPKGILSEEREALEINAFVTLGRYEEARERGKRFLVRHPGSLLGSSVEAALRAIP